MTSLTAKAGIKGPRPLGAAHQKAGADEKDDAEGDLHREQQSAKRNFDAGSPSRSFSAVATSVRAANKAGARPNTAADTPASSRA